MKRFTAFGMACAALALSPAWASQPTLFYSPADNGIDPGSNPPPPIAPNGVRTLALYLNPGGVASLPSSKICGLGTGTPGAGDETCGLHFEIAVNGDLDISTFTHSFAAADLSWMRDASHKVLRVALVNTSTPLPRTTTRIGTLTLSSGVVGGQVTVAKLQTVDADLTLQTGAPRPIAFVPEPGAALQLAAGAGCLAGLAWRRARRGGVR